MTTHVIGDWRADLSAGWIERNRPVFRERSYPDARLMAVLVVLLENAGSVVSTEELLEKAWPDRVVGRDSLATAIYGLRKLLHDDAAAPSYIRTEARRGYRLIAPVSIIRRPSNLQKFTRPAVAISAAAIVLGIAGVAVLDVLSPGAGELEHSASTKSFSASKYKHSIDMCPEKRLRRSELVTASPTG